MGWLEWFGVAAAAAAAWTSEAFDLRNLRLSARGFLPELCRGNGFSKYTTSQQESFGVVTNIKTAVLGKHTGKVLLGVLFACFGGLSDLLANHLPLVVFILLNGI